MQRRQWAWLGATVGGQWLGAWRVATATACGSTAQRGHTRTPGGAPARVRARVRTTTCCVERGQKQGQNAKSLITHNNVFNIMGVIRSRGPRPPDTPHPRAWVPQGGGDGQTQSQPQPFPKPRGQNSKPGPETQPPPPIGKPPISPQKLISATSARLCIYSPQ